MDTDSTRCNKLKDNSANIMKRAFLLGEGEWILRKTF